MTTARPSVVILAGPNGAGKSTAAPALLQGALAVNEFVNADVIARGLSAFDPDAAAIAAGRVMLTRMRELAAHHTSFAFETTLASRTFAPWLRELRTSGYDIHLVFLWLSSAELASHDELGALQQFWTAAHAGGRGVGVPAGTGLRYRCVGDRRATGRMKANMKKDVSRILRENRRVIDEALKKGVRDAMLRHKKDAMPVVIERNGKIEWVNPEDLGY